MSEDEIKAAIESATQHERKRCLAFLERYWTFDNGQQHTHSWHSMADCMHLIRTGAIVPKHFKSMK